mgnify:CR=1 FL=1
MSSPPGKRRRLDSGEPGAPDAAAAAASDALDADDKDEDPRGQAAAAEQPELWLTDGEFRHAVPWFDRATFNCKGAWKGKTLRAGLQLVGKKKERTEEERKKIFSLWMI